MVITTIQVKKNVQIVKRRRKEGEKGKYVNTGTTTTIGTTHYIAIVARCGDGAEGKHVITHYHHYHYHYHWYLASTNF